jgi:hypothetical protein
MVRTKQKKSSKDDRSWDLITIVGVCLLALAVYVMYRVEQDSGQAGGSTQNLTIKQAGAQTNACSDGTREPCDEAAKGKSNTTPNDGDKANKPKR